MLLPMSINFILSSFRSQRQNFGGDLLAFNIQRGRDHGLPGYTKYRKICGLREVKGWRDRPSELEPEYWNKLQEVYENVDDIDLYLGAIAETNVQGGVVGPTFACLIGQQFRLVASSPFSTSL